MLKDITRHCLQAFEAFFDEGWIGELACETGFVQRRSKLTSSIFLKALIWGFIQHPRASLSQLCQTCFDFGVLITPQGLDQRLNEAALNFLRLALEKALMVWRAERKDVGTVLDQFAAVYIQDSTISSLPEALDQVFPGAGGNASSAAVKIQLLFDFLSGNMENLAFVSGRTADQGYRGHLPKIQAGSMLIQDLGYFNLKHLQAVVAQVAFFLTRWKRDTCVSLVQNPGQFLDMVDFLSQQQAEVGEYDVLLGATARLRCRMLCVRLPEAVRAKRRRRAKADAKRRGETLSRRSLALLDWNVFLTNVPPERLSTHHVLVCYSLRWQVELIFKLWKSEAALKHLAGFRQERVLAELYAKMIGIVLTHFLVAPLRFLLRQQRAEISSTKARQVLQDRAKQISLAIGIGLEHLDRELAHLYLRILQFARKTKRRKRPSTYDKILVAQELTVCQLYPLA